MHHRTLVAVLPLVLAASTAAQDVLYYKFDEAGGKKAINYASGSGVAPKEGTLVGGNTPQFAPGVFGATALMGGTATNTTSSTYVDTGWTPNLANSNFTLAFFIKQRTAPPSTSYFFYSNSGFRMFTGGVAAKGLYFRNGTSGTGGDWILTTDIQSLAATAWTHIALAVDATALTATYYVNGVAQTPLVITGGVSATGGTYPWRIAGFATYGGLYDVDEFRVTLRTATAAEILGWSARTSPADGAYGAGCQGATLGSTGGLPKLGNATYALKTGGGNLGNVCALAIGTNRLKLGAIPLPLDLGVLSPVLAGCAWESSAEVFLQGVVLPDGTVTFALPIPNVAAFEGTALFTQGLLFAGVAATQATNGFSLSLGQ